MSAVWIMGISLLLAFLNILMIRFVRIHFPKFYFSLGQLIITEREDISLMGFVTKFFPPFIISLILGLLNLKNSNEITILFSFFSSFLVIWPVILCGDELLSWEAKKKKNILYMIYFFYISEYIVFAEFGVFVGKTIRGISVFEFIGKLISQYNTWSLLIQNIVAGFIGSFLFAIVAFIISKIYKRLFKGLWTKIIAERRVIPDSDK